MTETPADEQPDTTPDATNDSASPDPDLAGAGLSATGKTADQFEPGDEAPGTTYGAPTGADGDARETVEQDGS